LSKKYDLQNLQSFNRYKSAADCSILLKCGTEFDQVTADTFQACNVNKSQSHRVTYQQ